jgi:hypothetical protein
MVREAVFSEMMEISQLGDCTDLEPKINLIRAESQKHDYKSRTTNMSPHDSIHLFWPIDDF